MKHIIQSSLTLCAIALSTTLPAFAGNLSDITGPNVSDITGPNVSDITGPNVSDITGTSVSSNRARKAVTAGFDQEKLEELADDLGAAYAECAGGGDCSTFNQLLETSNSILAE